MRRMALILAFGSLLVCDGLSLAASREEAVAALRARIAEYGDMYLHGWDEEGTPRPGVVKQAKLNLLKEPIELVREAIDIGIRDGERKEQVGAFAAYGDLIGFKREPINPAYHPILLRLLREDDLSSVRYTTGTAGSLNRYPSRETLLAFMDAAARTQNLEVKEMLILQATGVLGMELRIDHRTTPLEKARVLSEFQAWFAANKDHIRFNSKGEPRITGDSAAERLELSQQDRGLIRKDPTCVLQLANVVLSDEDEESDWNVRELNSRCGVALLGAEGAVVLTKAVTATPGATAPSLDLQAEMVSLQGKYPVIDAVLLAVAYVAAYEKDPEARRLAKETLEDFGEPMAITRTLEGEPRVVRKMAMELAKQVNRDGRD